VARRGRRSVEREASSTIHRRITHDTSLPRSEGLTCASWRAARCADGEAGIIREKHLVAHGMGLLGLGEVGAAILVWI